jgi:hypothetical protein
MKAIVLMTLFLTVGIVQASDECPRADLRETAEDCPWAGVSRLVSEEQAAGRALEPVLMRELPRLLRDLDIDSRRPGLTGLWGRSINFDEGARGIIVLPELLDFLGQRLGVHAREDRVVHAGMEHTYGYLFSNLQTSFGYKRARWVRDDIEFGLGLTRGTLGPEPREGTLLGNVTYFIARISGVNVPEEGPLPLELTQYDYRGLEIDRLEETLGSLPVVIRTDLVKFKNVEPGRANARLLVHSIVDSRAGAGAKLITAFPVDEAFATRTLNPTGLGEGLPITTRYNAFVEGITGANPPLTGSRRTYVYRPRHPSP